MNTPGYSIIIPVLSLEGNSNIQRLLNNLNIQTHKPEEVHLVIGDKRQGRAINYGASKVITKYICTVDDDTEIDDPDLYKKLLTAMETDNTIGLGGAACPIPAHATVFQKQAMKEIPRRFFPVQKEHKQSDFVQHPCLIMRTDLFRKIGGEDEQLIRGLDPILRHKVREYGKKVVIIADTWVYHIIPNNLWKLIKMYYRNGRGSGFARRYYPERVIELSNGMEKNNFRWKRPFYYRMLRRLFGVIASFYSFKAIKLITDTAYTFGVIKETLQPSYRPGPPPLQAVETKTLNNYSFLLHLHRVILEADQ